MKTFKMMAMALMAVAMCANFASCSNEDVASEEQNEYVTVKLGCGGEILDIKNSPLSRAGEETVLDENDMLLLSITELEANGYGGYENKSSYAYAVMPYQSNLEFKLLKGRYYRVYASVIVDGIERGYTLNNSEYKEGGIVYESNGLFYEMGEVQNEQYDYDRFYGMYNDFEAVEDANVSVDLYRVAFGAKILSSGLAEGESLNIEVCRYQDYYETYEGDYTVNLDAPDAVDYRVRTVNYIDNAWNCAIAYQCGEGEEYSEHKYLKITWNKLDSETGEFEAINMGTYDVPFKRNANTTVTIVPQDLNAGGMLTITAEAWGEDIGFVIENGQVTEQ